MSLSIGNVSASLTLDISGYSANLNSALAEMKGFMGNCALLSVNLQNLGSAFVEAGNQSVLMNQKIKEGIAALSAIQKSAYAEDLKAFSGSTAQKYALFNQEASGMSETVNKLYSSFIQAYKNEYSVFATYEKNKTTTFKTELKNREKDLNTSMQQMISTLSGYVGNFLSLGTAYGQALLNGILSTKSAIMSYLDSVSRAYRSVTNGSPTSANANSGSGSYTAYSRMNAYATDDYKEKNGIIAYSQEGSEDPGNMPVVFSGPILQEKNVDYINNAVASAEYSFNFHNLNQGGIEENVPKFDYDRLAKAIGNELASVIKPAVVYNPVYNSPKELSLSEIKKQDTLNMRRLGFNF